MILQRDLANLLRQPRHILRAGERQAGHAEHLAGAVHGLGPHFLRRQFLLFDEGFIP